MSTLVRLHRWQPRGGRYRTETVPMDEGLPILDLLTANGSAIRVAIDPASDQRLLRTQRVDRVTIANEPDGVVVDVYLSPIVERKYQEHILGKLGESKVTKKKLGLVVCECHHTQESHAGNVGLEKGTGLCLIPGCACKRFAEYSRKSLSQELDNS